MDRVYSDSTAGPPSVLGSVHNPDRGYVSMALHREYQNFVADGHDDFFVHVINFQSVGFDQMCLRTLDDPDWRLIPIRITAECKNRLCERIRHEDLVAGS